ncbi:MAG TPA: hypothetical protein PK347_07135 [Burkholderiaceae bacterium]|nr:hypothetical protein [Burkholderiaceae bacterium]
MYQYRYVKGLLGIALLAAGSITLVGCKTMPSGQGFRWVDCASEGQLCRTQGPTQVRYGAQGRYEYRYTNGPIWCGNDSFRDPAPGLVKHCQMQVSAGSGASYPGGSPTHWEYCAREDGVCHPPHGATVRFGARDRHAYARHVSGPISCSVRTFGDPIRGVPKACEFSLPGR